MENSHRQWENVSVFVRNLERKVPMDWVVRDVRLRSKVDCNLEGFSIMEDHLILRFRSEVDYSEVLKGGPWFVAGQLMAMEAWEPDFVPRRKMITKAVVWLRLPTLPMSIECPLSSWPSRRRLVSHWR